MFGVARGSKFADHWARTWSGINVKSAIETVLYPRGVSIIGGTRLNWEYFKLWCWNQIGALLFLVLAHKGGRDSSVGMANRYGLDGPEFEFPVRMGLSLHVQAVLVFRPFSCTVRSGSLSREVKRTGRDADDPPSSSAVLLCYGANFTLRSHKNIILCYGANFTLQSHKTIILCYGGELYPTAT